MSHMIQVEKLKKSYGDLQAVKGIDFYVEKGKVFAFLGPNGAGKSTTIDILCTLSKPDSGNISINDLQLGTDDSKIRSSIGVVFQDSLLDPILTVKENLTSRARFYSLSGSDLHNAVDFAAQAADTTSFMNRPYGKLSGGQRRRADIARALVNTPKILFLDEPTTGLDPKTKESVWNTVSQLQKNTGMTIFLTTHYMEEAQDADYIIILNEGQIAARGTPYDLKESYSSDTIRLKSSKPNKISEILDNAKLNYREKNGLIIADIMHTRDAIPIINAVSPYIESFEVIHGSMDDVFLNITGGELCDD